MLFRSNNYLEEHDEKIRNKNTIFEKIKNNKNKKNKNFKEDMNEYLLYGEHKRLLIDRKKFSQDSSEEVLKDGDFDKKILLKKIYLNTFLFEALYGKINNLYIQKLEFIGGNVQLVKLNPAMSENVKEIENMKVCLLFLLEETIYLKFICIEIILFQPLDQDHPGDSHRGYDEYHFFDTIFQDLEKNIETLNNIHKNTTNNTTNNTKNKKNTTNNTKNNISGPIKEKLKEIFKSSIYQKEFYENNPPKQSEDFKKFKTKFSYLFDESNSTSVSSTTSKKKKPIKTTSSVENVSPKESLNIKKLVKTNPINNENPMLNKRVNFFKTNFRKEYYKNNREKFEEMLNFIQLDEKKNIIPKVYIFDIMNLFNNKSVVKNNQNKKSIIRKARDEPIRFYLNFLKNETEKTSIIDSNLYIKVFPSEISDNTFKIIKIQNTNAK